MLRDENVERRSESRRALDVPILLRSPERPAKIEQVFEVSLHVARHDLLFDFFVLFAVDMDLRMITGVLPVYFGHGLS